MEYHFGNRKEGTVTQLYADTGVYPRDLTLAPYSFLGILNIDQVGLYQIGEFIFLFNRNLLTSIFRNFFELSSDVHSHFTRNSKLYHSNYARTNIHVFYIKSIGATIWNKIPLKI